MHVSIFDTFKENRSNYEITYKDAILILHSLNFLHFLKHFEQHKMTSIKFKALILSNQFDINPTLALLSRQCCSSAACQRIPLHTVWVLGAKQRVEEVNYSHIFTHSNHFSQASVLIQSQRFLIAIKDLQ